VREAGVVVDESDIMGAFLNDEDLPTSKSRETLPRFVQDLEDFDLSGLIGNLHNHIERSEKPYDYYRIMLEFARVPRSVWREVKTRFMKSLEAVGRNEFTRPFRMTFPATDCTFMIAPLDPQIPATGPEGEKTRIMGLENLTYGAMYDAKASKGVGILISRDGEYIQIDWSLLDVPWKPDPEMDAMLAKEQPIPRSEGEGDQQLSVFGGAGGKVSSALIELAFPKDRYVLELITIPVNSICDHLFDLFMPNTPFANVEINNKPTRASVFLADLTAYCLV
jgi:hypothetical protein